VTADPAAQRREQRPECAGEPDDELRPLERGALGPRGRMHRGVCDLLDALLEQFVAQPARELGPLLVVAVREALDLNAQLRLADATVARPRATRKNGYRLTFCARPVARSGFGPNPLSSWLS
jgi:hypothetical protein